MNQSNVSNGRQRAFTLIELLVVITIIALLAGILLPAMSSARLAADRTVDVTHLKSVVAAATDYTMDNKGMMMSDDREPGLRQSGNVVEPTGWGQGDLSGEYVETVEDLMLSWFGKIEPRVGSFQNPDLVDCPIIDDAIRKYGSYTLPSGEPGATKLWYCDYSLNHFGLNVPISIADEPARNVMFGEPNMRRYVISYIAELVAGGTFGDRPDLEENQAGSLAFGFVDGHAGRVTVPKMKRGEVFWKALTFSKLAMHAGTPPDPIVAGFSNRFWWSTRQVKNGSAQFGPANGYTDATLPPTPDPADRGEL